MTDSWYLEYEILQNRPGLLGDISSLIGILKIQIITITGVNHRTRGVLLHTTDEQKIELLLDLLKEIDDISLKALRKPTHVDLLAVRHGRFIEEDPVNGRILRFVRDELGLLVDFLGELFKSTEHLLIGIRGMPRVGKTEAVIAGSVCANRRWTILSSTLLKQTIRTHLMKEERSSNQIFLIDGALSASQEEGPHVQLIREVMQLPAIKVVEHPDIFLKQPWFGRLAFDYMIELRNEADELIVTDYDELRG